MKAAYLGRAELVDNLLKKEAEVDAYQPREVGYPCRRNVL